MNLFNVILVQPIINLLITTYQLLAHVHIPYALGWSIIILTVVIRFVLYPLTASQIKISKKMQKINPHVSKLKEKHKNDPQRLQQEMMLLYKEYGVNPAAGCLPVLIQLPLIWALYSVLQHAVAKDAVDFVNKNVYSASLRVNHNWDVGFFGLPLGDSPSHLLAKIGIFILLVPAVTAVLQFVQSKMMFPAKPDGAAEKKKEEDFAQAFQTQSLYLFPIMIGFFSYGLPIGLSLYWNAFTIFGIIQQYKIQQSE